MCWHHLWGAMNLVSWMPGKVGEPQFPQAMLREFPPWFVVVCFLVFGFCFFLSCSEGNGFNDMRSEERATTGLLTP